MEVSLNYAFTPIKGESTKSTYITTYCKDKQQNPLFFTTLKHLCEQIGKSFNTSLAKCTLTLARALRVSLEPRARGRSLYNNTSINTARTAGISVPSEILFLSSSITSVQFLLGGCVCGSETGKRNKIKIKFLLVAVASNDSLSRYNVSLPLSPFSLSSLSPSLFLSFNL